MKIGDLLPGYLSPPAILLRLGVLAAAWWLMQAAFLARDLAFLLRVFCFVLSVGLAWIGIKPWQRTISLQSLRYLKEEMFRRQRQQ